MVKTKKSEFNWVLAGAGGLLGIVITAPSRNPVAIVGLATVLGFALGYLGS